MAATHITHPTTPCHRYSDTVTDLKTTTDNAPNATSNTHTKYDLLKAERGQQKMRWLGSIIDSIDMRLSIDQTPGVSEGQGRLARCSPMGLQRVGHNLVTEPQQPGGLSRASCLERSQLELGKEVYSLG